MMAEMAEQKRLWQRWQNSKDAINEYDGRGVSTAKMMAEMSE